MSDAVSRYSSMVPRRLSWTDLEPMSSSSPPPANSEISMVFWGMKMTLCGASFVYRKDMHCDYVVVPEIDFFAAAKQNQIVTA